MMDRNVTFPKMTLVMKWAGSISGSLARGALSALSDTRPKIAAWFTVQMLPLTISVISHSINHLSMILTPHPGEVRD
jgi:hypothetical protein